MWNKKTDLGKDFITNILEYFLIEETTNCFTSMKEFEDIIKYLLCWKAEALMVYSTFLLNE